jgi:hypothetical protein
MIMVAANPAMLSFLGGVLLLPAMAAMTAGTRPAARVDRLRDLSRLLQPLRMESVSPTLHGLHQAAEALHGQLAARGHAIRGLHSLHVRTPALLLPTAGAEAALAVAGKTISPLTFGADPSGTRDSSTAIQAAMQALRRLCGGQTVSGSGNSTRHLAFRVTDCGGVTLDLEGGVYLLSQPMVLPAGGNLHITGGSLRAAASFPRDRWLMESGVDCLWHCEGAAECKVWQNSTLCHEDVTISNVYFDANRVASGGLLMSNTMGCLVTACYFIGFVSSGIKVVRGRR